MALTRKYLTALGIEAEKIDQIIEEHSKTVNDVKTERDSLKDEVDRLKTDAADAEKVKAELEKVRAELSAIDVDALDKKYKDLKSEYDEYKTAVEAKQTHASKLDAYRGALMQAGVAEKRIASVLKVSEVDKIELDDDGKIKDVDKLIENIKSEWADFIQTSGQQGADVSKPPANIGGDTFEKMSLNEKMEYANEHPEDASVKAWLGK